MASVSEQEFGTLLSIISRCDADQVRRTYEALKHRQATNIASAIRTIRVGAKVKWNGKAGVGTGKVQKVKQKYVEVIDDVRKTTWGTPMVWNVPASMLEVLP